MRIPAMRTDPETGKMAAPGRFTLNALPREPLCAIDGGGLRYNRP